MGKIFAITSTGKTEKSLLDLRFGKCENVLIFNVDKNKFSIFENSYKNEEHSGIKLINHLKKEGVTTIITGEIGPKAGAIIEKEKLQLVLLSEERIKIEEVLNRIKA
jgi:predicted Fe-Mo cluster-binding NifX family protein